MEDRAGQPDLSGLCCVAPNARCGGKRMSPGNGNTVVRAPRRIGCYGCLAVFTAVVLRALCFVAVGWYSHP